MSDREFIRGFNDGYLLSKHEPQLLNKILLAQNRLDYFDGLKEGKKEFEKEKFVERLKDKSKNKSQDKEMEL